MIEQTTSRSRTKSIEEAPVRELIIEETTTSNFYWDVGFEFEFCKYTEEDSRLSDARLLERRPGEPVVCMWRYYYDHDDDLLLGQRFVLTHGYGGYFRRPLLPDGDGEIKVSEGTRRSSAA